MAKERYGLACEYKYTIGIYNPEKGTLKYVDSVSYGDKSATWKKGAKPLAMTKNEAIQIQMGLLCNGYTALVIELPDYMFEYIENVEELYGTDN